jgi:hypothetical protein
LVRSKLYIHERFLARLAASRFVLNGGTLLAVLDVVILAMISGSL